MCVMIRSVYSELEFNPLGHKKRDRKEYLTAQKL
jgi:hypothetical protein